MNIKKRCSHKLLRTHSKVCLMQSVNTFHGAFTVVSNSCIKYYWAGCHQVYRRLFPGLPFKVTDWLLSEMSAILCFHYVATAWFACLCCWMDDSLETALHVTLTAVKFAAAALNFLTQSPGSLWLQTPSPGSLPARCTCRTPLVDAHGHCGRLDSSQASTLVRVWGKYAQGSFIAIWHTLLWQILASLLTSWSGRPWLD